MTTKIVKSYTFATFCSSNQSDSQPYFHLQLPEKNVVGYNLSQVTAVNTVYDIDSRNNQFAFVENPGLNAETTLVAILEPGNYTLSTFLTKLSTALTSVGSNTYTVTNNSLTNRLTITSSSIDFKIVDIPNHCYYESGFVTSSVYSVSALATSSFDFSGLKTIHIICNTFNGTSIIVNQNYTILASIPVNVPYQGVLSYDAQPVFITCQADIYNFQFYLLDERFRPITMDKSWSCNLLLQLL